MRRSAAVGPLEAVQRPDGDWAGSATQEGTREQSVGLRTEFAFLLPRGYVDASGAVHRDGVMPGPRHSPDLIP